MMYFVNDRKLPPLNPGSLPPTYINVKRSKKDFKVIIRDPEIEKTNKVSNDLSVPSPPVTITKLTKKEKAAVRRFCLLILIQVDVVS